MAYYDPYAFQDPFAYLGYGAPEPSTPPEPSKDWMDTPKINRTYVRNIKKDIIKVDFLHLKSEQFYCIEAMVEYIELLVNEDNVTTDDTKDKIENKIVTTLKILNLPPAKIYSKKHETRITDRSATSLFKAYAPLTEFFQVMLSHCAKVAEESKLNDSEVETLADTTEGEGDASKDVVTEKRATIQDLNYEQIAEEIPKKTRIDVLKGNSILLMMTGYSMIQTFQKFGIRVGVGRNEVIGIEDDLESETTPIGTAVLRFPDSFHRAVLQQGAAKRSFSLPLVGYDGGDAGQVGLTVTLVCMGRGVEVGMAEEPKVYRQVKFLKNISSKEVELNFDPIVPPRLAITLMNMEPPLHLCRTGSEIIQKCLESKLVPSEGSLSSNYKPRKCRWLDIVRDLSLRTSKHILSDDRSGLYSYDLSTSRSLNDNINFLRCPRPEFDPELDNLWRNLRIQCAEFWGEVGDAENKKNTLYDELEELLKQDKGEGWGSDILSEQSNTSREENRTSKSSRRSGRKSTLKSLKSNGQND